MNAYEMDYSGPRTLLPTKAGPVDLVFTDASHAHVSANASSGRGDGDVEFRGKHWYVSLHLYAEHGWGEDPDAGYRHQFTESGTYGDKTIARTYRVAIVSAIQEAVSAFVVAHPDVLPAAQRNHLTHDLECAEKELYEADATALELRGKVNRLRAELDAVKA